MSTDLVPAQAGLAIATLDDAERWSAKLAKSNLIPSSLKGKEADVLVVVVTGHELGLSPMQALRGIHVVQGRPVLAAELLAALVQRSPVCEYFMLAESTDARAVYQTKRKGQPTPISLAWTIEQAKAAKLTDKDNWVAHPAAMLRARCSAALARAVYPDLTLGMLVEDEAEEMRARGAITVTQVDVPQHRIATEDVTDAEIVDPETGEIFDGDPGQPTEQEQVEHWTREIWAATDAKELSDAGARLSKAHPDKDSPIRAALRDVYAARQKELRQ